MRRSLKGILQAYSPTPIYNACWPQAHRPLNCRGLREVWVSKEKKSREPLSRAATILEEKDRKGHSFKGCTECRKKMLALEGPVTTQLLKPCLFVKWGLIVPTSKWL